MNSSNSTNSKTQVWEPKIVGFLCNWCSYAGADLAGTSRIEYPSNVRIIRVPCSGRVNPLFVLKCLMNGADGVLIVTEPTLSGLHDLNRVLDLAGHFNIPGMVLINKSRSTLALTRILTPPSGLSRTPAQ